MDQTPGSSHSPQLGPPLRILIKMQNFEKNFFLKFEFMCKGWSAISSRYILIVVYPFSEDDSFALWHIQYQLSAVSGSPQVSERGSRRDSWTMVGTRAGERERERVKIL